MLLWTSLAVLGASTPEPSSCAANGEIAASGETVYRSSYLDVLWSGGRALEQQMGNMLSLYWHHRALALVGGHAFSVAKPPPVSLRRSWLAHLPATAPASASAAAAAAAAAAQRAGLERASPPDGAAWRRARAEAEAACAGDDGEWTTVGDEAAPHLCRGSWTQGAMLLGPGGGVVGRESRAALRDFQAAAAGAGANNSGGDAAVDAAVHFRCGDLLRGVGGTDRPHHRYGMMPWRWVAARLPLSARRIVVVGNVRGSGTSAKVRGAGDPTSEPLGRPQDAASGDTCAELLLYFGQFLRAELQRRQAQLPRRLPVCLLGFGDGDDGACAGVIIEARSRSVSSDFELLARAPVLVGSVSSFALWAAVLKPAYFATAAATATLSTTAAAGVGSGGSSAAAAPAPMPLSFQSHLPLCDLFFRGVPPRVSATGELATDPSGGGGGGNDAGHGLRGVMWHRVHPVPAAVLWRAPDAAAAAALLSAPLNGASTDEEEIETE